MRTRFSLLFIVLIAAVSAQTTGWQLVWSDEFNGAAGSPPDPTKWNYDLGDGGWGNGEAETYTNSSQNVFQDGNGNLIRNTGMNPARGFSQGPANYLGPSNNLNGPITNAPGPTPPAKARTNSGAIR